VTSGKKRTGAAGVAASLRQDIIDGTLRCHERLPAERDLADEYRVSRGTVRQALFRLREERLVKTQRGAGTFVIYEPEDSADRLFVNARPLELIDARFALEPHICRLVVLQGRRDDFERFEDLLSRMDANRSDPNIFSELDSRFHETLAWSTGNSLLVWLIAKLNLVRKQPEWERMRKATLDHRTIAIYNRQHREIVEAIYAREPEKAANLMKEHLETARLSLTRAAAT